MSSCIESTVVSGNLQALVVRTGAEEELMVQPAMVHAATAYVYSV